MSVRQIWEGCDKQDNYIAKLSGETKLCVLFFFSFMAIIVDNPRSLFLLFTFALSLHLFSHLSFWKWRLLAILILLGLWGSMLSQALFFAQTPRTILITLIQPQTPLIGSLTGGINIYQEGIIYGAVQGLRSALMLTMGLLVCWNSDPRQLLQALVNWGLSSQLAFMLVTAIRFLPVLAAEANEVLTALKLRANCKKNRNSILLHLPYIFKPLMARTLRRAQTLALSVTSRGIFSRTALAREIWPKSEQILCSLLGLILIFFLFAKGVYYMSEQGIYFGSLRNIYDWTKNYL